MAYVKTELQLPAEIESLYNLYSPMLYGLALYMMKTEQLAEDLIIGTFISIYQQKHLHTQQSPELVLIHVLMRTAQTQSGIFPAQSMFRLKHFEQLPLLNMLICMQLSLFDLCRINQLTRQEVGKLLRQEFLYLRNMTQQKANMWIA